MTCLHTLSDQPPGNKFCKCCGRTVCWTIFPCADCDEYHPLPPKRHDDRPFTFEVVTDRLCMFCDRTGTRMFFGDDTVVVCDSCVKGDSK